MFLLFVILFIAGITIANEFKVSFLYFINRAEYIPFFLFSAGFVISFPLFGKFYKNKSYLAGVVVFFVILIIISINQNIAANNLMCGLSLPLLIWGMAGLFSKTGGIKPFGRIVLAETAAVFTVLILTLFLMKMADGDLNFSELFLIILYKIKLWVTL